MVEIGIQKKTFEADRLGSAKRALGGRDVIHPLVTVAVGECGSRALAGPLVVAATAFRIANPSAPNEALPIDGNAPSDAIRCEGIERMVRAAALATVVLGRTSQEVDSRGLEAVYSELVRLVLARCIEQVVIQGVETDPRRFLVLLDGHAPAPSDLPCPVERSSSGVVPWPLAAAATLARAHRDSQMRELDEKYPQWCFARHLGEPVADHWLLLDRLGPSPIHRAVPSGAPSAPSGGVVA